MSGLRVATFVTDDVSGGGFALDVRAFFRFNGFVARLFPVLTESLVLSCVAV